MVEDGATPAESSAAESPPLAPPPGEQSADASHSSRNANRPLFILVYNISKFRDLRKSEEDYGFGGFGSQGGSEKPPQPGKLFADLLTDGPEQGMHAIIWCDSASNLERWFSRSALKELEQRIAFQMNAADSSNLVDTPAASRLGVHRALLYREETGGVEKFRPYGPPSREWLQDLRRGAASASDTSTTPHCGPLPEATDLDEFMVS